MSREIVAALDQQGISITMGHAATIKATINETAAPPFVQKPADTLTRDQIKEFIGDTLEREIPSAEMLARLSGRGPGRGRQPASSGQYKGVYQDQSSVRWTAQIWHGGKNTNLGRFATEEEAARAHDAAAHHLVHNM